MDSDSTDQKIRNEILDKDLIVCKGKGGNDDEEEEENLVNRSDPVLTHFIRRNGSECIEQLMTNLRKLSDRITQTLKIQDLTNKLDEHRKIVEYVFKESKNIKTRPFHLAEYDKSRKGKQEMTDEWAQVMKGKSINRYNSTITVKKNKDIPYAEAVRNTKKVILGSWTLKSTRLPKLRIVV
ncbi:hypothetical protein ABEB36_002030 [Hypothenemus hampei]|uniref:Uncharacterized protein n=1 Tax=Hypothenemus hampei TaxID=57062 RepID=A0ABD1F4B1_HYPHA